MFIWLQRIFKSESPDLFQKHQSKLTAEQLQTLAEQLLNSPYLQKNILNQRFASTQGFSVIFRNPQDLLKQFPEMQIYLEQLDYPSKINLFYLNVLVIGAAGQVDRHIDHSIRGYSVNLPLPIQVSVLYVQVPKMQGGELLLYDSQDQLAQMLRPQTGLIVNFDGKVKHAVNAIEQAEELRISLVCEQYQIPRTQLHYVPEFCIKSMASFDAFLKKQL